MRTTQFLMLTTTLLLLNNANKQPVQPTQAAVQINQSGDGYVLIYILAGLVIGVLAVQLAKAMRGDK